MHHYGKQAAVLSTTQERQALAFIAAQSRNQARNKVIFLLSIKAALRAKEIADLKWRSVIDSEGQIADTITVESKTSKGGYSGGIVPINKDLRAALRELQQEQNDQGEYVIRSERGAKLSAESITVHFHHFYKKLGITGASGHSGRRTAITRAARKISSVGGSLRDVQIFSRHSSITTTQRYIEANENALRHLVDQI